mgnify:CR=1 FL=1
MTTVAGNTVAVNETVWPTLAVNGLTVSVIEIWSGTTSSVICVDPLTPSTVVTVTVTVGTSPSTTVWLSTENCASSSSSIPRLRPQGHSGWISGMTGC